MRLKHFVATLILGLGLAAQSATPSSDLTSEGYKLIFSLQVIRHGDRTPTKDTLLPAYEWAGKGQLTPEGIAQEHALGKKLREKYVLQTHLLPERFNPKTVWIESTNYDRTLMSAEAVFSGLYPLGTGPLISNPSSNIEKPALPQAQAIAPIHIFPIEIEARMIPDKNEEAYRALVHRFVESTPLWHSKTKALEPYFKKWSQALNTPIHSLYDLKDPADILMIRREYHAPLPSGLSNQEIDTLIQSGQWAFIQALANPSIGQLTGSFFWSEIQLKIQNAIDFPKSPRFVLFSTHDSVIMALLSNLHLPLKAIPPYASDLSFDLYQTHDAYELEISFNGVLLKREPWSLPS